MLCLGVDRGCINNDETQEYIRVRNCCTVTANEEMMYSRRFLDCCELIYVTVGKVYIAVEKKEYAVGAGEAVLVPCYQVVEGVRPSDMKTTFYTVSFSCSEALIENIAERVVPIQEDSYFIGKLFQRLENSLLEHGSDSNYEGDALCLTILCGLRDNIERSEKSSISILNTVMDYINENMDKMLTIETIANHFGYNKDYLLKIFRERYGITIKKYINEKKLANVKQLLTTTDMPVSKIGASIGFTENELFEKYFKYHEKVTPQRYRKINR